jgi:hypothetical protein
MLPLVPRIRWRLKFPRESFQPLARLVIAAASVENLLQLTPISIRSVIHGSSVKGRDYAGSDRLVNNNPADASTGKPLNVPRT